MGREGDHHADHRAEQPKEGAARGIAIVSSTMSRIEGPAVSRGPSTRSRLGPDSSPTRPWAERRPAASGALASPPRSAGAALPRRRNRCGRAKNLPRRGFSPAARTALEMIRNRRRSEWNASRKRSFARPTRPTRIARLIITNQLISAITMRIAMTTQPSMVDRFEDHAEIAEGPFRRFPRRRQRRATSDPAPWLATAGPAMKPAAARRLWRSRARRARRRSQLPVTAPRRLGIPHQGLAGPGERRPSPSPQSFATHLAVDVEAHMVGGGSRRCGCPALRRKRLAGGRCAPPRRPRRDGHIGPRF